MNTPILAIALAATLLNTNAAPTWQTSYSQGREMGTAQKKPMVIVFGNGSNPLNKNATPEIAKLLAEHYVCVFIDTALPAGKQLAQSCEIASGVGFVISDRKCQTQAYWHQGDISNDNVAHYLKKYADPLVAVGGTETFGSSRLSFYPAPRAMTTTQC